MGWVGRIQAAYHLLKARFARPGTDLEGAALLVRAVGARVAAGLSPLEAWSGEVLADSKILDGASLAHWPHLVQQALIKQFGTSAQSWVRAVGIAIELTNQHGVEAVSILESVAESIERQAEFEVHRQGLLSGPKASLQVLSILPILAVVAAELSGLRVLGFLFGSVAGWACLLVGLAFWGLGIAWSRALVRSAQRKGISTRPVSMDLVCVFTLSLLGVGFSPLGALEVLGQACPDFELLRLAQVLTPFEWQPGLASRVYLDSGAEGDLSAELLRLRQSLQWCADSGAAPEALLCQCKDAALRDSQAVIITAAGRLGTLIVLPLGLCFLPAFILLGMVPVVISLFA